MELDTLGTGQSAPLDREASAEEATAGDTELTPPEELGLQHSAARLLGEHEPPEQPEALDPRPGVLCAYYPDWTWRDGTECWKCNRLPPLPPDLYQPRSGRCKSVRLCVSGLKLSLGVLEPMQLVVLLYNLQHEKRALKAP